MRSTFRPATYRWPEAGAEYVQLSPAREHQAVAAAMVKNMQEAQRA
jgi:hypothetical protein